MCTVARVGPEWPAPGHPGDTARVLATSPQPLSAPLAAPSQVHPPLVGPLSQSESVRLMFLEKQHLCSCPILSLSVPAFPFLGVFLFLDGSHDLSLSLLSLGRFLPRGSYVPLFLGCLFPCPSLCISHSVSPPPPSFPTCEITFVAATLLGSGDRHEFRNSAPQWRCSVSKHSQDPLGVPAAKRQKLGPRDH